MRNTLIIIIIGFIIIISIGVLEIVYIDNVTENFKKDVLGLEKLYNLGYTNEDTVKFDELMGKWEKNKKILSIFVVHDDIEFIEKELVEISAILKNNFSDSQISANFALLMMYIDNTQDKYKFTLKNIL